jgi:uncharacterized protein YcnI
MHTPRRATVVALIAAGALVSAIGPAAAHVEPDPTTVKPGTAVTIAFTPEHGCDQSPITKMTFRIPKGAQSARPEPKDGWATKATGTTVGKKITFSGGSMPSDDTDAFSISFTAPKDKSLLTWKAIQTCEDGVERWIEGPDGDFPAPVVRVGKKVASAEHADG